MDSKIIKKIELDIDGVGITLTPQQAKKLQGALNELLGVEKEKEYIPQPYRIWPYSPYWYGDITWGTTSSGATPSNINGVNTLYSDGTLKLSVQ